MAPPRSDADTSASETATLRKRFELAPPDAAEPNEVSVYTWQEVSEHNSSKSLWVIVSNKVYDLTKFLDKHPGGREILLLMAGRDATAAFESYHPFTDKPKKIIEKYEIGVVTNHEFPTYKPDSGFYATLRKRVNAYFKENNLNPKNPVPGIVRMILVTAVALISFLVCNNYWENVFPFWSRVLFAILFGVCQAMPLLHVMHDSSHTAFGNTENWWSIGGRLFMDLYAGANMTSWHYQHVVGHHIYTNVYKADPDLPVSDFGDARRLVNRQIWKGIYKYQHIYLPPLYGILALKFRIQDFTDTFFGKSNGPVRVNPISSYRWFEMFFSKAIWLLWRITVPLYYFNISVPEYFCLFLISEWITGYFLAFNFQVSHVSTECDYPMGEKDDGCINDEWAVSQVKTSVDYSHGSFIMTFLSGALNYQVTHHLFPGVSQYHYPAIAPIIMSTCEEYGIQYNCLPSFASAFRAHINHLKNMGMKGIPAEIHMG